jgi:3-methyladenine DNA glycosylase AlkD
VCWCPPPTTPPSTTPSSRPRRPPPACSRRCFRSPTRRGLEPADLAQVEAWVREAHGWAYADSLAADIAGTVALRHPAAWPPIDPWATDEDFWVRRSALLTLLPGIRRGQPDQARFERYATPMLAEREFFIRKAIGWVLREISKKDPAYVAGWTERHLDLMSGVTLREAVRRLPEADAARLRRSYTMRTPA